MVTSLLESQLVCGAAPSDYWRARLATSITKRYLLPAFLMLFVLVSALLSHVLEPRLSGGGKALRLQLWVSGSTAAISAALLAQHYFIGPAYVMP